MSRKAAVTTTTAATIVVIIGLTMQATAYLTNGATRGPAGIGFAVTVVGFIALAANAPLLHSTIRTAAHDDAYLSLLADQEHDQTIARHTKAPVRSIDRRAQ